MQWKTGDKPRGKAQSCAVGPRSPFSALKPSGLDVADIVLFGFDAALLVEVVEEMLLHFVDVEVSCILAGSRSSR